LRSIITATSRVALLLVVASTILALMYHATLTVAHAAPNNTAVLTYKNDSLRSGQNRTETILNTSNVNASTFGKRISYPVDGYVYAQPLFMANLSINGGKHNVVFVATQHDSVYALDSDQKGTPLTLWHTSFIDPAHGITTISSSDVNCGDIVPEIGITGTPVIDANSGTLYVVAATKENGTFFQRLHALDITTGHDKVTPTVIKAAISGSGDGSVNGIVHFDALKENQRSGLLLLNGTVYIAWASHCDHDPYHGWLIGYNASTLQKIKGDVYNVTRNGSRGGVWMSGGGLASDTLGNIYFSTGNGTFDLASGGKNAGDTIVKLGTQGGLHVADYFTPFNQSCLELEDADLGSGGTLLLPSQNELIEIGKEGRIYVVNRSNMGKYTSIQNPCSNEGRTDVDKVLQELAPGTVGGMWSSPAYWNGPSGKFVYTAGTNDNLKAFQLNNGLLNPNPTSRTPEQFGFPAGNPTISSNGSTANTGILWTIDPTQVLRAYNATNLGNEIYNSNQNQGRDGLPSYVKFSVATVANGRVFVGTQSTLEIYGLLN
jgi:hypothetical protein